ncbi:TetR/AcrR family transcriptional regulator [Herbiconiux daphne]|uniref:TetR/AcrR family transcriptional regulator n=1 Tax=Herbiconiux daphne TaxID=2970914 RepID=A0ABT2H482_9MICO|nr:TetR/AcrR family transcriptional regulator [Herbiconiux daphne]MCS5734738.1 TetR/AcrR family transcriptional regulator [Herbiconiux daphne]
MTLTAKGRATRDRIVDGAATFLRENELGDITLDDVRAVTNTSKSQLFHYFPGGKEDLLLAVMHHEADRVLSDQQPYLGTLDDWPAWNRWRDAVIARYRAQGAHCPLNSLIGQVGTTPGADEVVRALLSQWQGLVATGIRSMQDAGLMRTDLPAERLAGALVAGIQGGVVIMWSTGTTDHLEAVLDALFDYLRA